LVEIKYVCEENRKIFTATRRFFGLHSFANILFLAVLGLCSRSFFVIAFSVCHQVFSAPEPFG
jgi:hypothetical protein